MSSNLTQFQLLLDRADIIKEKHRQENLDKKFNIFSILRSESDEVNLHSRFIYELLNPKGAHNQNTIFLKLFLYELNKEDEDYSTDVELKSVVVKREFRSESGRYDLLIRINDEYYIIENKIYQSEDLAQLLKYYEGILGKGKQGFKIVLLTLFDHELSNDEVKEKLADHFMPITYKKNIISWLEECIKETAQNPLLRETLVMYRNLVLKITGQSYSEGMIQEMKVLILENRKNLENAIAIEKALVEAKIFVQGNLFWKELEESLCEKGYTTEEKNYWKWSLDWVSSFYKKTMKNKYYGLPLPIISKDQYAIKFWVTINDINIYYSFILYDHLGEQVNRNDDRAEYIELWNQCRTASTKLNSSYQQWLYAPASRYNSRDLNFRVFNTGDIYSLLEETSRKEIINELVDEIIKEITDFQNNY